MQIQAQYFIFQKEKKIEEESGEKEHEEGKRRIHAAHVPFSW